LQKKKNREKRKNEVSMVAKFIDSQIFWDEVIRKITVPLNKKKILKYIYREYT
jgi:hypothetical protein